MESSKSSSLDSVIYLCNYALEFYNAITVLDMRPTTPPPIPSQPRIFARHTGHLASAPSASRENRPRLIDASTALNRHSPQHTCPHGVIVALVTTPKQIGQVYAVRGSIVGGCSLSSNWVRGGSSDWDSCTPSGSGPGKTSSSGERAGRLPLAFSDRGPSDPPLISLSEFSGSNLCRLGERSVPV